MRETWRQGWSNYEYILNYIINKHYTFHIPSYYPRPSSKNKEIRNFRNPHPHEASVEMSVSRLNDLWKKHQFFCEFAQEYGREWEIYFYTVDKTWAILGWSHCIYTWQICNNCRKLRITQRNLYQSIIIIPDTIILPHTPAMVSYKQGSQHCWSDCVCKYSLVLG